MKKINGLIPILAMLALILDSKTATEGAAAGVALVLKTAIPALFPFFVLSAMILPACTKLSCPPLAKLLGTPPGWESVFLLGCVGGYPVGAQCVSQGYSSGRLAKKDAERMLGFCTNCGPSFLFGILRSFFPSPWEPLGVYVIGILSAFLTALIWSGGSDSGAEPPELAPVSLSEAVQRGLKSMAFVGAWIILGRMLLGFLEKYLLFHASPIIRTVLTGFLELTNGCLLLENIPLQLRFSAACAMTTFGGLCVWMQVRSICTQAGLDGSNYLPQKLTACGIAMLLSILFTAVPGRNPLRILILVLSVGVGILSKKAVEFSERMVYNRTN